MKRLIATLLVTTVALIGSYQAKAIEDPYQKRTILAGVHFAALPGIGTTAYGEYVIVDSWWKGHFSVGAQFGYNRRYVRTFDVEMGDLFDFSVVSEKTKWNYYAITTRANYGLNITEQFEVHAGVLLGVGLTSTKEVPETGVGFAWGGTMGLRYFFTDFLGGAFELQYTGYSPFINIGLTFKF